MNTINTRSIMPPNASKKVPAQPPAEALPKLIALMRTYLKSSVRKHNTSAAMSWPPIPGMILRNGLAADL